MQIPFLGPSNNPRSPAVDSSRSINWYPELNPADSKSVISMVGTPGTYLFSAATAGVVVRGMRSFNNLLYIVAANKLYSVGTSGIISLSLGTLNTSTGRVYMSDNGIASAGVGGDQLAIVDGTNLYIYNVVTPAFTVVTGGGLLATPSGLTYIDGYFIVTNGTMGACASNLYNGLTWGALAIAAVIGQPDNISAPVNFHNQLWLIKEYSSEVWYNNSTSTTLGFPFSRISGAIINYGTKAPATICQGADSLFFLAWERNGDKGELVGVVQLAGGYVPTVVSTVAVNYRISQLYGAATGHTNAFAYFYSDEGHSFAVITFPTGDATYVYDVTTQMWHERSTYSGSPYEVHRHISNCYAFFDNRHLVGDWDSGNVYEMSSAYFEDNGLAIASVRISQPLWDKQSHENVIIHKLQVDAETGIGVTADQLMVGLGLPADGTYTADGTIYASMIMDPVGSLDPQALLSWSNDSGRTWSAEYSASMGAVGEYTKRLIWRRLGYSKGTRVFRLLISNTPKRNLVGAYLETSV